MKAQTSLCGAINFRCKNVIEFSFSSPRLFAFYLFLALSLSLPHALSFPSFLSYVLSLLTETNPRISIFRFRHPSIYLYTQCVRNRGIYHRQWHEKWRRKLHLCNKKRQSKEATHAKRTINLEKINSFAMIKLVCRLTGKQWTRLHF